MSIKGLFADFRDYLTMRDEEAVRDFVGDIDWFLNQRNLVVESVPGAIHMVGIDTHSIGQQQRLVQSLMADSDAVMWMRGEKQDQLGADLFDNFGFIEMMGARGHYDCSERAAGFFLVGPNQEYPSHRQVAEELIIPLTDGTLWMRDDGPFEEIASGTTIVHESNETHALRTQERPVLALWMWRDGDLTQKPEF